MSANEFAGALLDLGNSFRDWQGQVEADLLAAEIAVDAFGAWIEPPEAGLKGYLEQCFDELRGLSDQLGLDADRLDRIADRLGKNIRPNGWTRQGLFAARFLKVLRDELRQADALVKDEPIGLPPLPAFQISLPPAKMKPLAGRLLDSGEALAGWAGSLQLEVAHCLGAHFVSLYSRSFLPSGSLLATAADLAHTLISLSLWLNMMAETYGHCEMIAAQFEPRLAEPEPSGALDFGVLIVSPEQVYHNELPLNHSVLADGQLSLPIQAEPEGA